MNSKEEIASSAAEDLLAYVEKLGKTTQDVHKTSIGFWEKLVLLDAGALTLSLSAATAFRGHTIGDAGVGFLFGAWKGLLFSIALATIAQWLTAASFKHTGSFTYQLLMSERMGRMEVSESLPLNKTPAQWMAKSNTSAIKAGLYEKLGSLSGACAVLSMLLSLWLLAKFGQVNLPVFLGK